jgi:hypothetical protein
MGGFCLHSFLDEEGELAGQFDMMAGNIPGSRH